MDIDMFRLTLNLVNSGRATLGIGRRNQQKYLRTIMGVPVAAVRCDRINLMCTVYVGCCVLYLFESLSLFFLSKCPVAYWRCLNDEHLLSTSSAEDEPRWAEFAAGEVGGGDSRLWKDRSISAQPHAAGARPKEKDSVSRSVGTLVTRGWSEDTEDTDALDA